MKNVSCLFGTLQNSNNRSMIIGCCNISRSLMSRPCEPTGFFACWAWTYLMLAFPSCRLISVWFSRCFWKISFIAGTNKFLLPREILSHSLSLHLHLFSLSLTVSLSLCFTASFTPPTVHMFVNHIWWWSATLISKKVYFQLGLQECYSSSFFLVAFIR